MTRRIRSISPQFCPYVIIVNDYIVIVSHCSTAIITTNVESWYLETAEFGYIECSVEVLTKVRGKKQESHRVKFQNITVWKDFGSLAVWRFLNSVQ